MKTSKNKKIIYRLGAKDTDIKHFKDKCPLDATDIIEPFGGSYALCRILYNDDKYNKYVNDNDPVIIKIFENPEKLILLHEEWNKLINNSKNILLKKKSSGHVQNRQDFQKEWFKDDDILRKYIYYIQVVRGTISKKFPDVSEGLKFIKKIIFTPQNYIDVLERHINNENAFIFLDPPYMFSNNTTYSAQFDKNDNTDMLYIILDYFKKSKAKIMLIINDLHIIRHLFKDYNFLHIKKHMDLVDEQKHI